MSSNPSEVQRQDWQDRDFTEILSRNVKKIADFLNHFDKSYRGKLAEINEKLVHLERQVEFLEASVNGAAEHQTVGSSAASGASGTLLHAKGTM